MMSTIHGEIEATEPRTLPDDQRRREVHKMLADSMTTGALTPLEALAAEAATHVDTEPDDVLTYEIQSLQHKVLSLEEKIGEVSSNVAKLTQAVLGRNLG
jgi:hypothetical protein